VRVWGGARAGEEAGAELGRAARRAGGLVGRLVALTSGEGALEPLSGGATRFRARPWALVSPGLLAQGAAEGAELLVVSAPVAGCAAPPRPGDPPRAAAVALLPSQDLVLLFGADDFRAVRLPGRREPGSSGMYRVVIELGRSGFCEGHKSFDRAAEALGRLSEMDFVCCFSVAGTPREPVLPLDCHEAVPCNMCTVPGASPPPPAAAAAAMAALRAFRPVGVGNSQRDGLPESLEAMRLIAGAVAAPPGVNFSEDFLDDLGFPGSAAPCEYLPGPDTATVTEGVMAPAIVEATATKAASGRAPGGWACLAGWGERHVALQPAVRTSASAPSLVGGPWSFCLLVSDDASLLLTEPPE